MKRPRPRTVVLAILATMAVGLPLVVASLLDGGEDVDLVGVTGGGTAETRPEETLPAREDTSLEKGSPTTATTAAAAAGGGSGSEDVVPAGDCIAGAANAPGTADPWGGCWPGPQNTGYPHGVPGDGRAAVELTNYDGPMTISSCGVVIDGKKVNGELRIEAGNGTHSASTPCVTITNSLVQGTIHTDNVNQGPVVIKDTEVAVSGSAFWANTGFYNTFDWRVNSHGGNATIKCQAYCESHDSWVHGMHLEQEFHYNAFGGNGIEASDGFFRIEHGYADCGGFASSDSPGSDAGCSADIGFYGDFAPVRNITITKTYFAPAATGGPYAQAQPGYCYNVGNYSGKPYPTASNVTFTNNVFAKGPTGKCGYYGAVSEWNSGNGNVWSGNRWDDGSPLNP